MKKLLLILIISTSFLYIPNVSAAEHKIESSHIHVYINEDGSARIIEKRTANFNKGTENFIVIGNLADSDVKKFIVSENGLEYTFVDDWNIDASQKEKTHKYGIIKEKEHYELIWGIGEYGRHEYIIEYTVTDIIKKLKDSQILFWRFVNDKTNTPPEEVVIEIESEHPFSEDMEKIWAFGFPGEVLFQNGKIIARNNKPLTQNDYMTILVKLPEEMFATNGRINREFEVIKERAFEGSDYGRDKYVAPKKESKAFFKFRLIVTFLILATVAYLNFKPHGPKLTKKRPKKFKRKYMDQYSRDFSYNGDVIDVYYLLYTMGVSNFEKILTSFILKWMKEEYITVDTEKVGFLTKRDVAKIHIHNKNKPKDTCEGELFHMMLAAADDNNILQESEFTIWVEKNKKQLVAWEQNVVDESLDKLKALNYVKLHEKKVLFITTSEYVLTEKGKALEKDIYTYVNYLHDYSLLNEHEAVNVHIWDNIMIWAAALGLTDVVQKQFEKLYPRYTEESAYPSGIILYSSTFSKNASDSRTPRPGSNGGGGSSSGGGGGGSSGGGSGGGTR